MILLDKILMSVVLIVAGLLVILFLKSAKDSREWFLSIRFLNFAEKLQPEENIGLLSRHKKRVALYALIYLAIGYAVVTGLYLVSNPGYIHYGQMGELIFRLVKSSDFWIQVLVWPLFLIAFFRT